MTLQATSSVPGDGSHVWPLPPDEYALWAEATILQHYRQLYLFALSLAGNEADAADLTQQTAVILATKGQDIREPQHVKSWLYTSLHREFLKLRRGSSRMQPREPDSPMLPPPARRRAFSPSPRTLPPYGPAVPARSSCSVMNLPPLSSHCLHKHFSLAAALLLPVLLVSCHTMSLADQRLLQQSGMKFGERGALTSARALPGHVERGRALSSNAAGGGCSSCH